MIDKDLIEKNRKRLEAEEKRLKAMLGRIAEPSSEVPGEFTAKHEEFGNKDDENASEVEAYGTNVAEERDLEDTLRKVQGALARMSRGIYGLCLIGGEEIAAPRLEAAPEAETCVEHVGHEQK